VQVKKEKKGINPKSRNLKIKYLKKKKKELGQGNERKDKIKK